MAIASARSIPLGASFDPYRLDPSQMPGGDAPEGVLNENWWWWGNRWLDYILNPDSLGWEEYEMMYSTDDQVFAAIEFLVLSILARLGDYVHDDEDTQDMIREQLGSFNFVQACQDILTALFIGFSFSEIIWTPGRGSNWNIGVKDIQTLHPGSLRLDIEKQEGPNKNKLRTTWQWWRQIYEAEIKPNKSILYSHNMRWGNPFGTSRLKRAFIPHFLKTVVDKAGGVAMERYGTPYTVAYGKLTNKINVDGQLISYAKYLGKQLDRLSSTGTLILPDDVKLELKHAASGMGKDFNDFLDRQDRRISRAIGLPSLMQESGKVGSHSLGIQQADSFVVLLEAIFNEFTGALIEQLVKPIIILNKGPQEDYGFFSFEEFKVEDGKAVAETLAILINGGVISTKRLMDMNWMREKLCLPLLDEEDLDPLLPTMPPQPAPAAPNGVPAEGQSQPDQLNPQPPTPKPPTKTFSWASRKRRRMEYKRSMMEFSRRGGDSQFMEHLERALRAG